MKEKKIAIIIMLVGGAVACLCCLINGSTLLRTLLTVFIALVVFLIVGLIVHKLITTVNDEVKEAEQSQAILEARQREAEEAARAAAEAGYSEEDDIFEETSEEDFEKSGLSENESFDGKGQI